MCALNTAQLMLATWPAHTAKLGARASGRPFSTVKRWVTRRACPDADTFLRMVAENRELRAELLRRLEPYGYDAGEKTAGDGVAADQRAPGAVGGSAVPGVTP